MTKEADLFLDEDLILDYMEVQGRLDIERELDRLLNVLNDVLIKYSTFDYDQIEFCYLKLKHDLKREYFKTTISNLDSTEMRVWHVSMFSSIELLRKLMENEGYDDPEDLIEGFNDILNGHFQEQLETMSNRHDIANVAERLAEPQYIGAEEFDLIYWVSDVVRISSGTGSTAESHWEPVETDMGRSITARFPTTSD